MSGWPKWWSKSVPLPARGDVVLVSYLKPRPRRAEVVGIVADPKFSSGYRVKLRAVRPCKHCRVRYEWDWLVGREGGPARTEEALTVSCNAALPVRSWRRSLLTVPRVPLFDQPSQRTSRNLPEGRAPLRGLVERRCPAMSRRIRTVKPEWLDDERLARCSDAARVLSVALLTLADDHGNGRAAPGFIAGQVWAYDLEDSPDPREVFAKASRALRELVEIQYVCLYTVDAQHYFAIRNWAKHQRVDKPSAPRVPGPKTGAPADIREVLAKHSRDSREVPATEGKGSGSGSEKIMSDAEAPDLVLALPGPAPSEPIVDRVFAHWQTKCDRLKSKRTKQRIGKIRARLADGYTEADLMAAIDGVAASDFHRGANDRGMRYDDLELILRDGSHVEKYGAARTPVAETSQAEHDRRAEALALTAERTRPVW